MKETVEEKVDSESEGWISIIFLIWKISCWASLAMKRLQAVGVSATYLPVETQRGLRLLKDMNVSSRQ